MVITTNSYPGSPLAPVVGRRLAVLMLFVVLLCPLRQILVQCLKIGNGLHQFVHIQLVFSSVGAMNLYSWKGVVKHHQFIHIQPVFSSVGSINLYSWKAVVKQ